MILMKEYISLTNAYYLFPDIFSSANASLGNSMLNHPGHVTLTSLIYLEIFTIDRYHRDMRILKILTYNSKQFRVYGILKQ